ncbi:MAG TPA: aldehyde dehydrogenase family protein, partial [Allosphingosinicella sp.]|nr:aldehyde dehydrogenase family protein [Allosphingosinicella sp.]
MTDRLTHFIDGERVSGETPHASVNPSDTGDIVARFPAGGRDEVDAAARAARSAFPAWSEASPEVRSDLLDKVGATIMARAPELGRL